MQVVPIDLGHPRGQRAVTQAGEEGGRDQHRVNVDAFSISRLLQTGQTDSIWEFEFTYSRTTGNETKGLLHKESKLRVRKKADESYVQRQNKKHESAID